MVLPRPRHLQPAVPLRVEPEPTGGTGGEGLPEVRSWQTGEMKLLFMSVGKSHIPTNIPISDRLIFILSLFGSVWYSSPHGLVKEQEPPRRVNTGLLEKKVHLIFFWGGGGGGVVVFPKRKVQYTL